MPDGTLYFQECIYEKEESVSGPFLVGCFFFFAEPDVVDVLHARCMCVVFISSYSTPIMLRFVRWANVLQRQNECTILVEEIMFGTSSPAPHIAHRHKAQWHHFHFSKDPTMCVHCVCV